MEKQKKKKFKLFDTQREGRGVEKSDVYTKTDLKGFFIKYRIYFTRLLSVNLLMVLGNFPLVFAALAMSTLTRIIYFAPTSPSFSLLNGIFTHQTEISSSNLISMGLEGIQYQASSMTNTTYLLFLLSALVIFTFGLVNVGTTYVLRNMVRGEPVFVFSDFFYAIKRNLWSGLLLGVIDFGIIAILLIDFVYFSRVGGTFMLDSFYYITCGLCIIYFFMRFYIYLMLVTFDIKIKKIFKNALIFSVLPLRNM